MRKRIWYSPRTFLLCGKVPQFLTVLQSKPANSAHQKSLPSAFLCGGFVHDSALSYVAKNECNYSATLQIGVYRGLCPRAPTKGAFEKVPLESSKLSKRLFDNSFLKVLEGGLGETSQCLLKASLHRAKRGGFQEVFPRRSLRSPTNPNLKYRLNSYKRICTDSPGFQIWTIGQGGHLSPSRRPHLKCLPKRCVICDRTGHGGGSSDASYPACPPRRSSPAWSSSDRTDRETSPSAPEARPYWP